MSYLNNVIFSEEHYVFLVAVRRLQNVRAVDPAVDLATSVRLTKICVIFLHELRSQLSEQKKVWCKNDFYSSFL